MQSFWNSLSAVEANCLKSLLDAASVPPAGVSLANRCHCHALLQETLAAREAVCERLQRSVQRASQRLDRAAHASASTQRELRRLEEAHVSADGSWQLDELRQTRGELQTEEAATASDLLEHQAQVQDLRQRLASAKQQSQHRRGDLEGRRERCLQEKLGLKEIHSKDLDTIRQETEVAIQKLELKDVERENLAREYGEEVKSLQSAELLAQQRQTELKRQRDEATEELAARLQEGNVLRDFCSQTHQELTQLSSQLRAASDRVEELEDSTDSEVEWEVTELQQRCHALERRCAHAQAAASRMPFEKLADLSFAESSHTAPLILEGNVAEPEWLQTEGSEGVETPRPHLG